MLPGRPGAPAAVAADLAPSPQTRAAPPRDRRATGLEVRGPEEKSEPPGRRSARSAHGRKGRRARARRVILERAADSRRGSVVTLTRPLPRGFRPGGETISGARQRPRDVPYGLGKVSSAMGVGWRGRSVPRAALCRSPGRQPREQEPRRPPPPLPADAAQRLSRTDARRAGPGRAGARSGHTPPAISSAAGAPDSFPRPRPKAAARIWGFRGSLWFPRNYSEYEYE